MVVRGMGQAKLMMMGMQNKVRYMDPFARTPLPKPTKPPSHGMTKWQQWEVHSQYICTLGVSTREMIVKGKRRG